MNNSQKENDSVLKSINPFGYKLSADIVASADLSVQDIMDDATRAGNTQFGRKRIILPESQAFKEYLKSDMALAEHGSSVIEAVLRHPQYNLYISYIMFNTPPESVKEVYNVLSFSETVDFFSGSFLASIDYCNGSIEEIMYKDKATKERHQLISLSTYDDYVTSHTDPLTMNHLTMFDLGIWWHSVTGRGIDNSTFTIGEIAMLCDPLGVIPNANYHLTLKWEKNIDSFMELYRPLFPPYEALVWSSLALWTFIPRQHPDYFDSSIDRNETLQIADRAVEISQQISIEDVFYYYTAGLESFQQVLNMVESGISPSDSQSYLVNGILEPEVIQRYLDNNIDAELAKRIEQTA